jgi:hypothetical protein
MLRAAPDYIPSRWELLTWLQTPPPKPISVAPALYDVYFLSKISAEALDQFFVRSGKASLRVWTELIQPIGNPPETGTTEDSFHAFWDLLIVKPFKVGYPHGVYNRNTSRHTSTRQYRPDLSYLVLDACLARGEEKGPENDDDPGEELISKLTWTYGSCPYVFGYYARAATVTYCYLYPEAQKIERKDLVTVDLNTLEGRLQAFTVGRNIGRLLPILRQTVPESFQREFTILHRTSGKVVELMQTVVVKRYRSVESVVNLEFLYDKMVKHQIPFIDRLEHVNKAEGRIPFVILSPKGIMYRPRSAEQLVRALYCVLTALKV